MIELFLVVACAVYILEYGTLLFGLGRSHRVPRLVPEVYPHISILVAARNEQENIERCVSMLLAQDYPAERIQLIIVNDESEDRTLSILHRLANEHPGRLLLIDTVSEASDVRGKARAIAQGMDHATGEIILLTDADCAPPPTWARATVEHFLPGVDLVGGFTIIEARDVFSATQQLDWVHLQTLASSALSLGQPVGIIGNNFAFRHEAYKAIGGYRAVSFSVTEDFALLQAMTSKGLHGIYPAAYDARMYTAPCDSIAQVLRQKHRWSHGAAKSTLPGYVIFVVALLGLIAFSVAPFTTPAMWLLVWIIKFSCDLILMYPNIKLMRLRGQLKFFLLFEFYFVAQALTTPLMLLNKTVVWKGRRYR